MPATVSSLAPGVGRQVPEPIRREVGAGKHSDDALSRPCCRDVDPRDVGVRVRRTNDDGVCLVGKVHIVGIAAQPLEEVRVLEAPDRLANGEFLDGHGFAHDDLGVYVRDRPVVPMCVAESARVHDVPVGRHTPGELSYHWALVRWTFPIAM